MFRRRPTRMLAATAALTMGIIFTAPVYAQSAADCAARADRAARDSGSAVRGGVGGAAGGPLSAPSQVTTREEAPDAARLPEP